MLILNCHIEDYIIYNYEAKKKLKMRKIQDFIGKIKLFFFSLLNRPWASFATWLHLEASQENTKIINKNCLSNIEFVSIHIILELDVLNTAKKLLVSLVTSYKRNFTNKIKYTPQGLLKIQLTIIGLIEILGVKL